MGRKNALTEQQGDLPSTSLMCVDELAQLRLGRETHGGGDHFAALEHQHRGDAGDAVFLRRIGIVIDVELADLHIGHVFRDFFDDRTDHLAWAAPRSPEVDQHGLLGLDDFGSEIGVGEFKGHGGVPAQGCGANASPGVTRGNAGKGRDATDRGEMAAVRQRATTSPPARPTPDSAPTAASPCKDRRSAPATS